MFVILNEYHYILHTEIMKTIDVFTAAIHMLLQYYHQTESHYLLCTKPDEWVIQYEGNRMINQKLLIQKTAWVRECSFIEHSLQTVNPCPPSHKQQNKQCNIVYNPPFSPLRYRLHTQSLIKPMEC